MPTTFNVTITISPPPLAASLIGGLRPESVPSLFPETLKRIVELAQLGASMWQEAAMKIPGREGRPLRLGTGPSDPFVPLNVSQYAQSITLASVNQTEGGLEAVIGSSDRQAIPIEIGGPAIDLHTILAYAPKARQGKKGRYLRVPFRQATTLPGGPSGARFQSDSNVLPPKILAIMRQKAPSQVAGTRSEPSINRGGGQVTRNIYKPGAGRLTKNDILLAGLSGDQGNRLAGLMRIGQGGHGGYITIRTLSESNPKGWRIAPYPGQYLANKMAEQLQELSRTWFTDALNRDAAGWVQQVAS